MDVFQVMEERQRGRLQYCNGIEMMLGAASPGQTNPEFDPT